MTSKQRIHFFATWNKCKKHMMSSGGYTANEVESERQSLLKTAGVKPDVKGRYSANKLTNDGLSTCLDFMNTCILGLPNQKRRSKSKIYAIEQLDLGDALLNKLSQDIFKNSDWRTLNIDNLSKLQMTAKRISAQQLNAK